MKWTVALNSRVPVAACQLLLLCAVDCCIQFLTCTLNYANALTAPAILYICKSAGMVSLSSEDFICETCHEFRCLCE